MTLLAPLILSGKLNIASIFSYYFRFPEHAVFKKYIMMEVLDFTPSLSKIKLKCGMIPKILSPLTGFLFGLESLLLIHMFVLIRIHPFFFHVHEILIGLSEVLLQPGAACVVLPWSTSALRHFTFPCALCLLTCWGPESV